jgi:aminopeptidase N
LHSRIPSIVLVLFFACIHAAAAEELYPRGQLPDTVTPERYNLTFEIDPHQAQFVGTADIAVRVNHTTRRIWLHGSGLAVSNATIETAGRKQSASYLQVDTISGVARLDVTSDLPAGPATIHLSYKGTFREGAEGFFRTQANSDWYVFSQMQPIDARRAFPGFDEPRFKTPFAITIITPAGDKAVSNAPLKSTAALADGRLRHEFVPTLALPTYLVAIAVGPLDIVEAPPVPANDIRRTRLPLRGVATRGQGAKLALALRETPALLLRLEQYFGIGFPYPKLDLIASPQMTGAMENAGAILFSDNLVLLATDAPLQQVRSFGDITAHEVAHHWFGDLVTPMWWDDIWLNESFAQWSGLKVADQWRTDLGLRTSLIADALGAMDVDSQRAGRPIREPIDDNTRIASVFDSITYEKGGGVLAMFESYMGEEVFRRGVHQHLLAHEHGNATARDFFGALARAAGNPVLADAFRTFVDQPGVPLVSVHLSPDGRKLELAQTRYRPLGSVIPPGGQWNIPFCASFLGSAKPRKACTLVTGPAASLDVPADMQVAAVMPNAAGAGYYRFAMEPAALNALLSLARTLPPGEGLALADSVHAAYKAGTLDIDELLGAASTLGQHPDRQVAIALANSLLDLHDRVLDANERGVLERRLGEIYGPRLKSLGLDLRAGAYDKAPAEQRLLRPSLLRIVALGARDKDVRATLLRSARASLREAAALDTSLRDIAWGVAAQEDPAFADALMGHMAMSQDGLLREHAAVALGLAEQAGIASRVRALAFDPGTRTNETISMLHGQFDSPVTRPAAWRWLRDHFDTVMRRLPGFDQPVAFTLPGEFCDARQRDEVEALLKSRSQTLGIGALELARSLERIDLCIAQKAGHADDIRATLGNQEPPQTALQ